MRGIFVIYVLAPLLLVGCSNAPSESAIQTALAQTQASIPTITSVPTSTSAPTNTPAPSPIPLNNIDLNKALLSTENLTLKRLINSSDKWQVGTSTGTIESWVGEPTSGIIHKANIALTAPGFKLEEIIYLSDSARQAARISEQRQQPIESWIGMACCDYEITTYELDNNNSIWMLRGNFSLENTHVLINYDEALIHIWIFGSKLIDEDILDIANAAVDQIRSVQYP